MLNFQQELDVTWTIVLHKLTITGALGSSLSPEQFVYPHLNLKTLVIMPFTVCFHRYISKTFQCPYHSFQVSRTTQQAAAIMPLKHGMTFAEIFGNKEKENKASCGIFNIDLGDPTTFTYPCDEFTVVLEGTSWFCVYW